MATCYVTKQVVATADGDDFLWYDSPGIPDVSQSNLFPH